jgi:hypothetical protein
MAPSGGGGSISPYEWANLPIWREGTLTSKRLKARCVGISATKRGKADHHRYLVETLHRKTTPWLPGCNANCNC